MKVYEVYDNNDDYYIVTELCKGAELFDWMVENGIFSENLAAKYIWEIVSAIYHCHLAGIVHRDIKPENLLFVSTEKNARLKVIDFGISKKIVPGQVLNSLSGTIYYIAPEVVEGYYDEKCDIWSCGVVLYIMLSGHLPFDGKTNEEVIERIMHGNVNFDLPEFEHVSSEAKRLVRSMLTLGSRRRPSAEEVLNDKWVQKHITSLHENRTLASSALSNLKSFRLNCKVRTALLSYLVSNISSSKEQDELILVFQAIDKNGDGKISMEELRASYDSIGLGVDNVEEIMKSCDVDRNGYIDFTEFCIAAQNWEMQISKSQIEKLFNMYDQDSSGSLTVQEMKSYLGPQLSGELIECIAEADKDGSGTVDLAEFKEFIFDKLNKQN